MRHLATGLLALLGLTACGGSSGGGSDEPEATPNDAPVMSVPAAFSGGPVQFTLQLPTASAQTLTFTATDADGDALLWQIGVGATAQQATGMVFSSPVVGALFTLDLQPVMAAATASVSVLVEDTRGAAAAVDLLIVRSGSPVITGVTPNSAFRTAPQQVTVEGSAFSLGNTVTTTASFAGLVGTDTVVIDNNTLTCATPNPGIAGPNAVAVGNLFGTTSLPPSAFTMYDYPVDFVDTDAGLDGGTGGDLVAVNDGAAVHVAWVENGMLMHRASTDGGATFAASQSLGSGLVPSAPRMIVEGSAVTIVWVVGTSSTIVARSSNDGGATFAPVVTVGMGTQIQQLQLVASGARRYCAWTSGGFGLGPQRVFMTSSADDGGTWRVPTGFQSGNNNQNFHSIGCDEEVAWVLAIDFVAPLPGAYLSRTTDGGISWTAGVHRGPFTIDIGSPRICNDGASVFLVWARLGGELEYMVSVDRGQTWPTQATVLRPASLGPIGEPVVACEGERLFAAYQLGTDGIGFSRVGAAGAFPEHVTISDVSESTGVPSLAVRGNYALVAWRGGDVAAGTARIRFASSVDLGLTFDAPTLFGDGTASQDEPHLLLDGARVWIGWRDSRGPTPAIFANRSEQ